MARLALPALSPLPADAEHSGIREISNEALRTPGAIRLDVGQPNFPTPKHIGDAGKRAIDENKTFYAHTQGMISLREKLVAKLERVNGIRVTPDRIACGPGGVGAIAAVFDAALERGDEVLLPDPGWPNTRLVERAQRHNLWLLSDECYDQIILDGSWTSPASLAPDDPRIASVFTFSKSYSMTGWRIGYVAGSAELIDTATKVLESNSSCVSTISQVAAEAALDGPQDCVVEMVAAYRHRRNVVVDILREAEMLLNEPTGAFYCMADISRSRLHSRDFVFKLLREKGVSVAPGSAFGEVAVNAVRISLASSDADLREGVGRLAEFVQELA